MSMDGGVLRRCVLGSETMWLRQDSRACSGCYDVGTLAQYLGVEPVEPPEPDAEEVRRFLDIGWAETTPEQDEVIWSAAAAWLRERERKQGGGA